jgi:3-oxoacyl-[acyl-carrier protein] reductase
MKLVGKRCLVTGGSRGLGLALCMAFARHGAKVAFTFSTNTDDAAHARAEIAAAGCEPLVFHGSVADAAHVKATVGELVKAWGGVDVLVNNAAYAQRLPITAHDAELIDRMHAINVRAPLLLIGALVPGMIERGHGSVISVSSVSGVIGTPMRSGYGATKGALDAASRCLARELGGHGIRVNTIAPGVVDTDLWARNKEIPGVVEQVNAQTPLGRWAAPEDIADVIVFLASDAARFITGETLRPDGGMSTTLDLYSGNV